MSLSLSACPFLLLLTEPRTFTLNYLPSLPWYFILRQVTKMHRLGKNLWSSCLKKDYDGVKVR